MRFLSDADLATLRAADEATTSLPLPTQMISNGEYTPLPQTEAQREVEGRIETLRASARAAARHEAPRIPLFERRAVGGVPGNERGFRTGVHGQPGGGSDAGPGGRAQSRAGVAVHRRLSDALRARRLQPADADHGGAFREETLESGPLGRRRPHAFQVSELREGDLPRQRHQGRADFRDADRRGRATCSSATTRSPRRAT